jgi:hypothetical protein
MRKLWAGLLAFALVPVVGLVVGPAGPAGAALVTVQLSCQASSPIGPQNADQPITIDVTAPASVPPGATFSVVAQTPVDTFPDNASGYTLNHARDFALRLPVPANATYVSSSLSGGSGLGSGTPTVGLEGSNVVLHVPGPIAGGATYQFPEVTVNLQATGPDFSTIQPRIGGTSFANPGFELTVNATLPIFGATDLDTDCVPAPGSPVLATTTIVPPDTSPPVISLATPIDGGSYPLGSVIAADYSCDDGPFGSGVAYCTGDLPDGATLDTSTLGTFSFTVTSDDNLGNGPTSVTHTYDVVPPGNDTTPPSITITRPPHGTTYTIGQAVTASYSCSDASGVASCVGTVANGAAIDTATAGVKTFTVDAVDVEGVPARVVHTYRVMPASVTQNFDAIMPLGSAPNRIPLNCDTLFGAFDESLPIEAANGGVNRAPTQAGQGGTFDWDFRVGRDVIPPFNNGSNLLYRFKAPVNGTFTAVQFTGSGSGINNPTISIVGGKIELRIASVVDAGLFVNDPFQPPPFRATVQTTGGVGSVVQNQFEYFELSTTLGGTTHCPGGDPDDSSGAEANPILTNTTVVDTTPPSVTITRPAHGAVYSPNSSVTAAYACSDSAGIASCTGTLPNGAAIDTSTSGTFLFGVTATDNNGTTTSSWSTYTVAPPTLDVSGGGSVDESAGTVTFDVTMTNPSSKTVTVDYSTFDFTATADADFGLTQGQLTFSPGGPLTQQVVVPILEDTTFEGDEAFVFAIENANNASIGTAFATVTIVENDDPVVSVLGSNVSEGDGSVTFTVSLSGNPNNPVTVNYQAVDGTALVTTDYLATSGSYTFLPGDPLSVDVFVGLNNDAVYEETETFSLEVTNPNNSQVASGIATIFDNEEVPPRVQIGSTVMREGDSNGKPIAQLTVTLNKAWNTNISVRYNTVAGTATSNVDYKALANKTLTFKPGQVVKKISVQVLSDTLAEGDETLSVVLSNPTNVLLGDTNGEIAIADDDSPTASGLELFISDNVVYEGNQKLTRVYFSVNLNQPATSTVTVTFQTQDIDTTAGVDYTARTPRTLTFKPGQMKKTIAVAIKNETAIEGPESFRLLLSSAVGATLTDSIGIGTIIDDD